MEMASSPSLQSCNPTIDEETNQDLNQNGMTFTDATPSIRPNDDAHVDTPISDSTFEVNNESSKATRISMPLVEDNNSNINEIPTTPQIPKIVIQSPEGTIVENFGDPTLLANVTNTPVKPEIIQGDVGTGDSPNPNPNLNDSDTPSQFLTPPSSRESAKAAMIPNNIMVTSTPDSDNSVTNEEDIEVICRYSSTPVNSCVGKTLNDTDCSMSTVDDVSAISAAEISKANVSSNRCATASDEPNFDQLKTHAGEHVEQDVLYLQQYNNGYNGTPKPNVLEFNDHHHNNHVPMKPMYGMYPPAPRDQDFGVQYQQHDYSNPSVGMYQGMPNEYPPYIQPQNAYSDFYSGGQRSWTDTRGRFDRPYVSYPLQNDPCCFHNNDGGGGGGGGGGERPCFVYPSIYVSSAGLISVLLRNDMSVEMTVDRTIRVVSHNHMMAVATDSKGTSACLYHPAVKVFQMGYATDISADNFRARMDNGDAIMFSNGINYFRLQDSELQPTEPVKFSDINRDQSVNLLFSSEGYGESLVATCMQVAAQAEYANLPKGGVIVRINGVKVTQSGSGDVTVVTGAKFIRLSPHNGTTRLGNRFLDIEVERDWSVKLTRGAHSFISTKKQVTVCNGKMEAGFDENNVLKVVNLQARYPLLNDPSAARRTGRKIVRSAQSTPATVVPSTPRRRFPVHGVPRGGTSSC